MPGATVQFRVKDVFFRKNGLRYLQCSPSQYLLTGGISISIVIKIYLQVIASYYSWTGDTTPIHQYYALTPSYCPPPYEVTR